MSFQAMTWATEQDLPAMQKIVLLMMANRTNHETGLCRPSLDLLAKECGMEKRSVINQIAKLEAAGLVLVTRVKKENGLNFVNQYRLKLKEVSSERDSLGSERDSLGSERDSPESSERDSPEPVTSEPVTKQVKGEVVDLQAKRRAPPPYQEIVNAYHETLPTLSQVYKLSESRKVKIKSLWADELDDLDSWKNYFKHIGRSDFLMGRSRPGQDGRIFTADFDFIINQANFIKIAEEKYHGKKVQR